MNPSEPTHDCIECPSTEARKPIAHQDALDEPIGHLCLRCYAEWMQISESEPDCAICGGEPAYYTVRTVSDLDGGEVLAPGNIGMCTAHALEYAGTQIHRLRNV